MFIHRTDKWLGLVCDAGSATLLVVQGSGPTAALVERRHVEFDADALRQNHRFPELEEFVAAQQLHGAPVHIAFTGAGAVIEKMQLPPLRARNRARAIRTRLARFAPGQVLAIAAHTDKPAQPAAGVGVLAAGIEQTLARGLLRACRRAGLRVGRMTVLAGALPAPRTDGPAVQLVLTERTAAIQLFHDGRLLSSRDVLLGRRDFVSAYQRPVLTENGAVTFGPVEAEELCRAIGVPFGREDEIRPGVYAMQLWPTLNPVLQRLRHELQQTLAHGGAGGGTATLRVLGAPTVPGLAEFLAEELQLTSAADAPAAAEATYLHNLAGGQRGTVKLDLRPPEERFNDRLTRPAIAAGLCALFIVFSNAAGPKTAQARVAELRPLAGQLQSQLEQAHQQRTSAEEQCAHLTAELCQRMSLTKVRPPAVPVVSVVKHVLSTLPERLTLGDLQYQGQSRPYTLTLHALYQGDEAASVVAANWARELGSTAWCAAAKVSEVSGSGQRSPAVIAVQATLK